MPKQDIDLIERRWKDAQRIHNELTVNDPLKNISQIEQTRHRNTGNF